MRILAGGESGRDEQKKRLLHRCCDYAQKNESAAKVSSTRSR
jgi:hypothetical protein